MSNFSESEKRIKSYFQIEPMVRFKDEIYSIEEVDKPTCPHGEPKTDIYILLKNGSFESQEVKISYKKENADFLENKTSPERAEQLFGSDWQAIIESSTESIKDKFLYRTLVYKERLQRTEAGSITLGWKFELLNKTGGELSGKMNLNLQQVKDVYAGTHLSEEKRNAYVNGKPVKNSGIANYILMSDDVNSAQDVIDKMVPIDDYVNKYPDIYFACKALNYRTYEHKYDGNRPLSVQVLWDVKNGKMEPEIVFDKPLIVRGNEMAKRLQDCMNRVGIQTTADVNVFNTDMNYVYGGNK